MNEPVDTRGHAPARLVTVTCRTAEGAFRRLEQLAQNKYCVFRGHREASWRLKSTLRRHTTADPELWGLKDELKQFWVHLRSTGVELPFQKTNNRAMLEYARHYGLPSPLIDFSRSPYVALFFAFNGVRPQRGGEEPGYAAVYCLDTEELGQSWARAVSISYDGKMNSQFTENLDAFGQEDAFRQEGGYFKDGFPLGEIKLLPDPSSWNTRMLRQMGLFIYDSLHYGEGRRWRDFEDFIATELPPPSGEDTYPTVLTKLRIPHSVARKVFERLRIAGITGTHLFNNHEGAVADVVNSYFYGGRTGTWD